MGFKVDESFIRFLTMGALGTRAAWSLLEGAGHHIIELERYSSTNKIWSTKIKRLRVPDLLCVRCGTRFEVRAKSKPEIRMSDSPDNPARRWDAGLRDEDLVIIVPVVGDDRRFSASSELAVFSISSLRASIDSAKLGQPKSASEGAERDRTWPSWVPKKSGIVEAVDESEVRVSYEDGTTYGYQLDRGDIVRCAYRSPGDCFVADQTIVAGVPARCSGVNCNPEVPWNPATSLTSESEIERYCAAKALGHLRIPETDDALAAMAKKAQDARVALEAAASLARHEDQRGRDRLREAFEAAEKDDLKMEVVFILSEIADEWCVDFLVEIAEAEPSEEIRSACAWGLCFGRTPHPDRAVPHLADASGDVAMHAIIGLSSRLQAKHVSALIGQLAGDDRLAACAAEVLSRAPEFILEPLLSIAFNEDTPASQRAWAKFVLGRHAEATVREIAETVGVPPESLNELAPIWRGVGTNWLASDDSAARLGFLARQALE